MSSLDLNKIILSAIVVLVIHLLSYLLKRTAKRTQQKFKIRESRYFAIKRFITVIALLLSFVSLVLIWNVNVKNAWISLTGILAFVAIAFFAVWSLVGNILAGFIIYFTSPFKVEDTIEVMPDAICGTVQAINTFYTVLLDSEGNYISIPNTLFFQRYIRVMKRKNAEQRAAQMLSEDVSSNG